MLTAHRSHLPLGLWDFYFGVDEAQCLRYLEVFATTETPHWTHYSPFILINALMSEILEQGRQRGTTQAGRF